MPGIHVHEPGVKAQVDKEGLGGSLIHTRNGAIDDEVESEAEAFERAKRFLSYLPSSVHGVAERVPSGDDPDRREEMLLDAVPRNRRAAYPIRPIIEAVAILFNAAPDEAWFVLPTELPPEWSVCFSSNATAPAPGSDGSCLLAARSLALLAVLRQEP